MMVVWFSRKLKVIIFIDENWAFSIEDIRFSIGYCTFIFENLVTLRNKKQNVVVRSNAEVEFKTVA